MQNPNSIPPIHERVVRRAGVPLLVAALLGWPATAALGQAFKTTAEVQVLFELRDRRHQDRYNAAERVELVRETTRRLVSACRVRFPHLEFTDTHCAHKLECVFNTGPNIEAPAQQTKQADAVWFHFRLSGPGLPGQPTHSWPFQELERYRDPIPAVRTWVDRVAEFLDEGLDPARSTPAVQAEADGRFETLYQATLRQLPVFTDRDIAHVPGTRLLVIKARRDDYRCSLPDLCEFHLNVGLPDPLGVQNYDFRARLLGQPADVLAPDLRLGLITEAFAPYRGTPPERLRELSTTNATASRTVYLLQPRRLDKACLETPPAEFVANPSR